MTKSGEFLKKDVSAGPGWLLEEPWVRHELGGARCQGGASEGHWAKADSDLAALMGGEMGLNMGKMAPITV